MAVDGIIFVIVHFKMSNQPIWLYWYTTIIELYDSLGILRGLKTIFDVYLTNETIP